jgi:hypothetical protein
MHNARSSEAPRRVELAIAVAVTNAKCMRSHGVPNLPDPTFLASGGNSVSLDGINTRSPAFKHAQAECPWPPHPRL